MRESGKSFLVLGLVIILVSLYCYGAIGHLKTRNTDLTTIDQRGYMRYAIEIYELIHEGEYFYGNRNRMPFYPFLQSFFYYPDLTYEEYFVRGKYVNVVLSVIILSCLFLIFQKYLPSLYAVNLVLITTFTLFIFKAAYFQCELLFYFLNFCGFLLLCKLLDDRSWKLGALTGIVLGLAYLTKASVLPGLALFLLFSIAKLANTLRVRLVDKHASPLQNGKEFTAHLLSIALVILAFLGILYPYISTSKRIFGHYFYNVNSTFYVWYDSWEEATQGTKAHGDRVGWPDLPPEQIPGPRKYLQEHTMQQIVNRVSSGLREINSNCRHSYGYYKYVLIYSALFLILVVVNFRHNTTMAARHPFLLLFCLSYFIVYLFLYAWYAPIASGNRLILAQFVPFMFSIFSVLSLQPSRYLERSGAKIGFLNVANLLVLLILVLDVYLVLTERILTMYGGS